MADTTQQGIAALKSGNRAAARQLLAAAVKENPNNVIAWLWLSGAVDKDEERAACLRQVLRIDPSNAAALKGLSQIQERRMRETGVVAAPAGPDAAAREAMAAEPTPPNAEAQEETAPPTAAREAPASEPAPPGNAQNKNHSPWATAQSAADSVASAVYGLRAELDAQTDEARMDDEASTRQAEDPGTVEDQMVEERLSAIDQAAAEQPPAPASAVEAPAAAQPAAPGEAAAAYQVEAEAAEAQAEPAPHGQRAAAEAAAYFGAEPSGRVIFRTRPSVVPALIAFWVFFFGSVAAANILSQADMMVGLIFGLVIGFLLELVIVYIAIRNMRIRYELTNRQISLPYQGKQVNIAIPDIFHAECQQTFWQRLVGLGDIRLDAIVGGELARLRMRDVPQCDVRAQQIMYLVKDLK